MKKISLVIAAVLLVSIFGCNSTGNKTPDKNQNSEIVYGDTADITNDFYDDVETIPLKGNMQIEIAGEVENPGKIDLSKLSKHNVIVKETILKNETDSFVGAYRYDGYSVYDILNELVIKKKNEKDFRPIIDLFVEIENDKGDKVVLSWGEIYYPIHRHEILIATNVMRIVPSKTKELWTLPTETRLVVAQDLITARNISNPVKITVFSMPLDIKAEKDKKPLYSPEMKIMDGTKVVETLKDNPKDITVQNYPAIFYGRGKGIHSTQPFTGVMMKDILLKHFPLTDDKLKKGLFVAIGADGYRSVYTYSEIMNRNDQSELLLVAHPEEKENAVFKIYPAMDFFSDRAVKAIAEFRYCPR
jgi:hypothetical protein